MSQKAPLPTSPSIEITHVSKLTWYSDLHQDRRRNIKDSTRNGPNYPHMNHSPCDAVQLQHAFLACNVVTQPRPSYASFDFYLPILDLSSTMILWLSLVHNFSVLTPFLTLMRDFGHLLHSFVSKQQFVSNWVAFEKWGVIWNGVVPTASENSSWERQELGLEKHNPMSRVGRMEDLEAKGKEERRSRLEWSRGQ